MKLKNILLLLAGFIMLTTFADAVVVITFSQDGDNVRVEANGTLDIGARSTYGDVIPAEDGVLSSSDNVRFSRVGIDRQDFDNFEGRGVAIFEAGAIAGLLPSPSTPIFADVSGDGFFGYRLGTLYFQTRNVVPRAIDGFVDPWAPPALQFDGDVDFYIVENVTLSDLGVTEFDNFTGFTVNQTRDTIMVNTITPVPEPSSIAFCCVGIVGLICRRKR